MTPVLIPCSRSREGMEPDDLSVLAQRAASEGPRWTRAVEDQSAPIPEETTSELGGIIRNLARRPQWDQHGCHSKGEASELGGNI